MVSSVVVSRIGASEDPFDDELRALVGDLPDSTCSEYVTGDNSLPVCDDAGDDRDDRFLASISQEQAETEEAEDEEDELYDLEPHPPKLKAYQEAVSAIEDMQTFLDSKGHNELATKLGSQMNSTVSLQFSSAKCSVQTRIDDFFNCSCIIEIIIV